MIRMWKRWARTVVRNNRFSPGGFGIITNPFYLARRGLGCAIRDLSSSVHGRVLDIGCGTKPYRGLFNTRAYIGLEVAQSATLSQKDADVLYDGSVFPFADMTFQSVICNQVLEHVYEPELFLEEVSRVLCSGGLLLLSVPFVWDEHEQPTDYGRYSSFGLTHLIEKKGFIMIRLLKATTGLLAIIQLVNGQLYKRFAKTRALPLRVGLCLLWSALNALAVVLRFRPDRHSDLYLDNVILAVKK